MEVWLPNSQELYNKALAENQILDLGLNFGDAVQGWFVPRYVVEGDSRRGIKPVAPDLKSVNDLKRYCDVFASEAQPGMGRLIAGSSGWFNYKISCMKLKTYKLDDKYTQIATGSEGALFGALRDAYQKGEPILLYMYEPSWPMAKFHLKQLEEPEFTQERWKKDKGCAFPPTQVKKLVYIDLPNRAPEVVDFIRRFRLDRNEISRILVAMKENEHKPEEAALVWLKENEDIWSTWVPSDVAQRVKQALSS
jgi:glycine betaine/proline transport system substrate-binding protein